MTNPVTLFRLFYVFILILSLDARVYADAVDVASTTSSIDADVEIKKMLRQDSDQVNLRADVSRASVLRKLGEPKRSDEFFPYSGSSNIVDYYSIRNNTQKLRVSYDRGTNVGAADVEPAPPAVPKFMCEHGEKVNLTEDRVRQFVQKQSQDDLRKMTTKQVKEKLGVPNHEWHETSHVGGRDFHFLHYLYNMAENGQKALIIMFDESDGCIYEYRLQTVNN